MNQTAIKTLSVLATLTLIAVIAMLYRHESLFSPHPLIIALQIISALLMAWARITFGLRSFHFAANPTEGGLVTTGPYRFIRNPIYAAVALFLWPGILAHASLATVSLGLLASVAIGVRVACEEAFLAEHFPDYAAYAKRTARLVPSVF